MVGAWSRPFGRQTEMGAHMKTKATAAIVIGLLMGGVGVAGTADAARCGGMPDGIVDPNGPETGTWDSPGEVISYFNRNGIHSNTFPAPPGQTVKQLCAGAPGG